MMAPVWLTANNQTVRIPILISEGTPVNLLGRNALCKLGLQIWCTPDGVFVNKQGAAQQMAVVTAPQQE